jgi:hypothetical protein
MTTGTLPGLNSAERIRPEGSASRRADNGIGGGTWICRKPVPSHRRHPNPAHKQRSKASGGTDSFLNNDCWHGNRERLVKDTNSAACQNSALGHSIESNYLADNGDALETATILSHKDTKAVHNHYQVMVAK